MEFILLRNQYWGRCTTWRVRSDSSCSAIVITNVNCTFFFSGRASIFIRWGAVVWHCPPLQHNSSPRDSTWQPGCSSHLVLRRVSVCNAWRLWGVLCNQSVNSECHAKACSVTLINNWKWVCQLIHQYCYGNTCCRKGEIRKRSEPEPIVPFWI